MLTRILALEMAAIHRNFRRPKTVEVPDRFPKSGVFSV